MKLLDLRNYSDQQYFIVHADSGEIRRTFFADLRIRTNEYLARTGKTQKDLAALIGSDQSAISQFLNTETKRQLGEDCHTGALFAGFYFTVHAGTFWGDSQ